MYLSSNQSTAPVIRAQSVYNKVANRGRQSMRIDRIRRGPGISYRFRDLYPIKSDNGFTLVTQVVERECIPTPTTTPYFFFVLTSYPRLSHVDWMFCLTSLYDPVKNGFAF